MADRKTKPNHYPAKSCFRFRLSACLFVPFCLSGQDPCSTLVETPLQIHLFLQNKANVKMGKMTISTATLKAYAKKQRTMNTKRYPKQTQSNPISNAQPSCPACQPKHCHVAALLTKTSLRRFPRSLLSVAMGRGLSIPPLGGGLPPRRCSAEARSLFPSGIIRFYPAAARALPAASRMYFSAGSLLVSRRCL